MVFIPKESYKFDYQFLAYGIELDKTNPLSYINSINNLYKTIKEDSDYYDTDGFIDMTFESYGISLSKKNILYKAFYVN